MEWRKKKRGIGCRKYEKGGDLEEERKNIFFFNKTYKTRQKEKFELQAGRWKNQRFDGSGRVGYDGYEKQESQGKISI